MEQDSAGPTLLNCEPKIGILIHATNLLSVEGYSEGKVAISLTGRVGQKDSTWEEKGKNDGADSDVSFLIIDPPPAAAAGGDDETTKNDAPPPANNNGGGDGTLSMGWCVYDTFRRVSKGNRSMELTLRLMVGSKSKVMGKDTKVTKVFDELVGQTMAGELTMDLKDLTSHEKTKKTILGVEVDITIGDPSIASSTQQHDEKMKIVPRTYPCGTNHFGMLPPGISRLSKNDLVNCTLWGEAREPMRSWVAVHFLFHYCPFQSAGLLVRSPIPPMPKQTDYKGNLLQPTPKVKDYKDEEVTANPAGAKSGYGATQPPDRFISNAVPMLETSATEDGKPLLLADPVMINYLTLPALYGPESYTSDVLRWELKIGYDYVPAIWRDFSGRDYVNIYKRLAPNYPQAMKHMWSPLMRWPFLFGKKTQLNEITKIQNYVGADIYNSDLDMNIKDIIKEFHWELKATKENYMGTGSGSTSPGPIDISFYGINALYYVAEIGPIRKFMDKYGLKDWMENMMDVVPPKNVLAADYFGPSMDGWTPGWLCDSPQVDPKPMEAPPPGTTTGCGEKEEDSHTPPTAVFGAVDADGDADEDANGGEESPPTTAEEAFAKKKKKDKKHKSKKDKSKKNKKDEEEEDGEQDGAITESV